MELFDVNPINEKVSDVEVVEVRRRVLDRFVVPMARTLVAHIIAVVFDPNCIIEFLAAEARLTLQSLSFFLVTDHFAELVLS